MAGDNRRGTLVLVLVALAAAVLLFLWLRSGGDEPAIEPTTAEATPAGGATTDPVNDPPGARERPALGPSTEKLSAALQDYREMAVYPPWSRPHDEGTEYKLAWNEPVISDLPFLEDGARVLMFRFGSDRAHVTFGESLTSWIEVWDQRTPDERLPAEIAQAWVISNAEHQGRLVSLAYGDSGSKGDATAGDHRYTNRFVPSDLDELSTPQQVRIMAEVVVGDERRIITRDFTYVAKPVLEVLGISDRIDNGSLVITLRVKVHQPGLHTFEANAMSGDGEIPIAYADMSRDLGKGTASVDLVFFGKIFHELAMTGPYQIRDIRGFLREIDGGENQMWSTPRQHQTRPYANTDFSAAEWDAEEKREKIRMFEELIESSHGGPPGSPGADIEVR